MAISAHKVIGVIGAGHMGLAIVEGLLKSGMRPASIAIATPHPAHAARYRKRGVTVMSDNVLVARISKNVLLAVKPNMIESVLREMNGAENDKVIISVAAGVSVSRIRSYAPRSRIIRAMPNMPVADNLGVIGVFAPNVPSSDRKSVLEIFKRLGAVIEVEKESDLDAVTLISGCGPGVVAYFISLMAKEAQVLGLSKSDAERIALQTFQGTLARLNTTGESPQQMQSAVATRGGVTEAIIKGLMKSRFSRELSRAYKDGMKKIRRR